LDCGCDAGSKHILKDIDNVTSTPENNIEDGEDNEDEDPADTGFVNASQVTLRRIEKMDRAVRILIPPFTI